MLCDDIGSIIVTIAIHCHGTVIQLDMPYERQRVFRNVRLFSKAGDFDPVYVELSRDRNPVDLREVSNIFAKDLNDSAIDLINEYASEYKSIYKNILERAEPFMSYPTEKIENICRTFHNITFDKSLSTSESGISCVLRYIFPELTGVFVISIHEKTHPNTYKLLYPEKITPPEKLLNLLNLKDFQYFGNFFGKEIPNLRERSTELNVENILSRINRIDKDKNLNEIEKEDLIKKLYAEYYHVINNWDITIKNDIITEIRLSYLVRLIKDLVGDNCKMNIFDYSCNEITKTLPESQKAYQKYVVTSDIENPPENWGGRKRGRLHKKNKYRKKTRKSRNKKRINKSRKD